MVVMGTRELHVVTGAFGYSGKYIARRLLDAGHRVRTLTNSPQRANPFGGQVEAHPFNFDCPDDLVDSLRGAEVLYNTYWVRFNYSFFRHESAVRNMLILFEAARLAGVRRVVHVSITNPSEDSKLEYFRGKARMERALIESGLSHAILRPTVLFGKEDILINNIAWALRHLPVFGVFGDGRYRLQPIYVDDLAALAVTQGRRGENEIINAIGPETFTYRDLVRTIGEIIGTPRPILSMPPGLAYTAGWAVGRLMGDVMITWPEVKGLMEDLLCTASTPAGQTSLTDWVREHRDSLGKHYASELARRKNREKAYEDL
jgi:NADH dehydrogenase